MRSAPGRDVLVLQKRKGFVRLALSYGCPLVPVYGVGVNDLYSTYDLGTLSFRRWFQKVSGVALPIFHGRFFSPLPYKVEINVLVGEPIPVPTPKVKGERVDDALVDEYHAKYIESLKKLYADNVKGRTLEIV